MPWLRNLVHLCAGVELLDISIQLTSRLKVKNFHLIPEMQSCGFRVLGLDDNLVRGFVVDNFHWNRLRHLSIDGITLHLLFPGLYNFNLSPLLRFLLILNLNLLLRCAHNFECFSFFLFDFFLKISRPRRTHKHHTFAFDFSSREKGLLGKRILLVLWMDVLPIMVDGYLALRSTPGVVGGLGSCKVLLVISHSY